MSQFGFKRKPDQFESRPRIFDRFVQRFTDINLQLQGDSLNLIRTKGLIAVFLGKLKFMKQNISRRGFFQFSILSQVECLDLDIQTYVQHLSCMVTSKLDLKIF